ncbi:hypothetical protein PPERSA_08510 [Pseudocohnilembus persalinus]|uniref:Poly(3-hydroxybutyrate) depolymerase n=1 Tax=Pseudocohnilembus persalinus TaxID=266149 RepID=A0A0V0R6L2_PSEPJ|nr:hypothetical protein PPERSA_08510 [Pseudocohnilembus persalinus]|eukprot:KRX10107.1 hypothetical protein PPERSA_08510 [Pseudocohnilembus persalinus]
MKLYLFLSILLLSQHVYTKQNLQSYNIDIHETSVSGLSAGAFMAVQLHIAFSSYMVGAGIVAGGPYICAQGEIGTALSNCMTYPNGINVETLQSKMMELNQERSIDQLQNISGQKVYLFSGSDDTVVKPGVVEKLQSQYEYFFANVKTNYDIPSQHAWITDDFGNKCNYKGNPYMNNCNFNLAEAILTYIFDDLNDPVDQIEDNLIEFDQSQFTQDGDSMNSVGYIYVPTSCQKGNECKVHIALHGCVQTLDDIGTDFVKNTGLNEFAESNNIIVLYPQCKKSLINPSNPNGCFDWWGYTDSNLFGKNYTYATKDGVQMKEIFQMLSTLAGKSKQNNEQIYE